MPTKRAQARVFRRMLDEVKRTARRDGRRPHDDAAVLRHERGPDVPHHRTSDRRHEPACGAAPRRRRLFRRNGHPAAQGRTFTRSDWNARLARRDRRRAVREEALPERRCRWQHALSRLVGRFGRLHDRRRRRQRDARQPRRRREQGNVLLRFRRAAQPVGLARGAHGGAPGEPDRTAARRDPLGRSGPADVQCRDTRRARAASR